MLELGKIQDIYPFDLRWFQDIQNWMKASIKIDYLPLHSTRNDPVINVKNKLINL